MLVTLAAAGLALLAAVAVGTVAHELSHAVVLSALGVPFEIDWLPGREDRGLLAAGATGTWATVSPTRVPGHGAAWRLRAAALTPLVLATPLALALVGALPDPMQSGDPVSQAAAIGWLACAIPSPQDFSLVWYAERALAERSPRD